MLFGKRRTISIRTRGYTCGSMPKTFSRRPLRRSRDGKTLLTTNVELNVKPSVVQWRDD